jgi:GntR family transcriptional regulator/MocR family aminotransferase
MPGVRVGYLLADEPLLSALAEHKRVHDLTTSPLMQRALDAYLNVGRYQSYLRRVTRLYGARRDALIAALARWAPSCQVRVPHGGLFCWVRLPVGIRASELVPAALDLGVEVAAGPRFFLEPADGESFVRLNFAACTPSEIEIGVRRFAAAVDAVSR